MAEIPVLNKLVEENENVVFLALTIDTTEGIKKFFTKIHLNVLLYQAPNT